MKELITYWGPFIGKVATVKAILNSVASVNRYSKNYSAEILNVAGEWNDYKNYSYTKFYDFKNLNYINKLPKYSFIKSRFSYIIIFLKSFNYLRNYLKTKKPDYLIVHLIVSLPLFLFLIFDFNTKLCLRISGFPKLNLFRKILWKMSNKRIYKVFCPTTATLKKLREENIFDENKLFYLPDPIISVSDIIFNKNKADQHLDNKFEKENIILVGRLTKQKNFKLFIESFEKISKQHKNLKANIFGDGELKIDLINQIKNKNLEDKIHVIGFKKNIFKYLKKSKIFVLTSLWEDPGFVLVEAGFSNLTVVSSNCPNGPSEILDDGKRGFLFENNNALSLTNCLNNVLQSDKKELFRRKVLNKKNLKKFTIFSHFKKLEEYLQT